MSGASHSGSDQDVSQDASAQDVSQDASAQDVSQDASAAFHIELRQFPHNLCRFNLTERELHTTIVGPWAREQWIELGERKWSPHQAKLTVLEGPPLPVEQLSMGRGWRAAERQGQDVTARVLAAAAKEALDESVPVVPAIERDAPSSQEERLLVDSLGLELLTQLGSGPAPLRHAWELALARHPERTASQCLMLAERAIRSLLASQLIVLVLAGGSKDVQAPVDETEVDVVLRAVDSWTRDIVAMARR